MYLLSRVDVFLKHCRLLIAFDAKVILLFLKSIRNVNAGHNSRWSAYLLMSPYYFWSIVTSVSAISSVPRSLATSDASAYPSMPHSFSCLKIALRHVRAILNLRKCDSLQTVYLIYLRIDLTWWFSLNTRLCFRRLCFRRQWRSRCHYENRTSHWQNVTIISYEFHNAEISDRGMDNE